MTFLISLAVILPTLMAVLLFAVAYLSFNAPQLLAASTNPVIAVCCIVAGVISMIPLFVVIFIKIYDIKSKKSRSEEKNADCNSVNSKSGG